VMRHRSTKPREVSCRPAPLDRFLCLVIQLLLTEGNRSPQTPHRVLAKDGGDIATELMITHDEASPTALAHPDGPTDALDGVAGQPPPR
jgi:hypothetical protein